MTTSTRRRRTVADPLDFLHDDPRHLTQGPASPYDGVGLFAAGRVPDPNVLIMGEPGSGKSTYVKCLLHRLLRLSDGVVRWVGVVDFRGEYDTLAESAGLARVRLFPGGPHRLNPLDAGAGELDAQSVAERRSDLLGALIAAILRRPLTSMERDAISAVAVDLAIATASPQPTLGDAARLLAHPTVEMTRRSGCTTAQLLPALGDARSALGTFLFGPLRGMFDGQSTVQVDWARPGLVLDLSPSYEGPATLRLAALACTSWLQAHTVFDGGPDTPRRYQVIDEGWTLLGDPHAARYLGSCWARCRRYGVASIVTTHRLSDLGADSRCHDCSPAVLAAELLADAPARVIFRQSLGETALTAELLELTADEALATTWLCRGRALWKVGTRTGVVEHVVAADEATLCPRHVMQL